MLNAMNLPFIVSTCGNTRTRVFSHVLTMNEDILRFVLELLGAASVRLRGVCHGVKGLLQASSEGCIAVP